MRAGKKARVAPVHSKKAKPSLPEFPDSFEDEHEPLFSGNLSRKQLHAPPGSAKSA